MSKLLVKFESNYADEFDVYGFIVVSKEEWAYKQLEWEHTTFPQELYFGTNEYCTFEDLKDYMRSFEVEEITDEELGVLTKFFKKWRSRIEFGDILWIEGNAPKSFYEENGYCPD